MSFSGDRVLSHHKFLLKQFWADFSNKGSRTVPSPRSKEEVLSELIRLGHVKLIYNSTQTREQFDKIKHYKVISSFKLCFACKAPAQVRHHIIWLKHGGRNQNKNIVGLCKNCHAEIHPWLNHLPAYESS